MQSLLRVWCLCRFETKVGSLAALSASRNFDLTTRLLAGCDGSSLVFSHGQLWWWWNAHFLTTNKSWGWDTFLPFSTAMFVCHCLPSFCQSALIPVPVPVSCSNSPNLVYKVVNLGFCLTSFYLVKPWPSSSRLQLFCQLLPIPPVISQSLSLFLRSQDKLIFSHYHIYLFLSAPFVSLF